jgi:signal transduction histidine kinase
MTFRKALITGHAILLLLAALTAVVAVGALQMTVHNAGDITHAFADELGAARGLRLGAEEMVAAGRGYLLGGGDRDRARFDAARNRFQGELAAFRLQPQPPVVRFDAAALDAAARVYETDARAAGSLRATARDANAVIPYFEQTLLPRHDAFETELNALLERERAAFEAQLHDTETSAQIAELALALAAAAAIGLGLIVAIKSVRRLHADYGRLEAARAAAAAAVGARDEMLAVVSHDLRTPLQTVVLGASLLAETADDDRVRRHVRRVGNAAARMRRMIETMLDAARIDAGTFVLHDEPCTAAALVDDTVEQFEPRAAEQAISLRVEHSADDAVRADHDRIVEVLSNLIDNAFKHTPRGGEIRVAAEPRDDAVRFVVTDTGAGIAAADLAHVFDRYWQADGTGRRRGVGLGLYICKRLVEAHRGAIGVASKPGAGAEFWFTLPRAATTSHTTASM